MQVLPQELAALASKQAGVLHHDQLAQFGMRVRDVDRRIHAGLWQRISTKCVVTYAVPLMRTSQLWAASLHHERVGLTGVSALEVAGMPPPHDGSILLLGPRGTRQPPFAACTIVSHPSPAFVADGGPTRTSVPLSVVHAMAYARSLRQAVFYCTAAVQRQLTDLDAVRHELERQPRSARMASARRVLDTVDPGVHSVHEYDFARECKRRGLPLPKRQVERVDSEGRRRFTDVEFRIGDETLIVEIDGSQHVQAQVFLDDQLRSNGLTLGVGKVLHFPGLALRVNPDPYFAQISEALRGMRARAGR